MQDDIYMRYLQQYYKEHGTIADVEPTGTEVVMFEGKKLHIAKFLSRMREEHRKHIDPKRTTVTSAKTLTRFNRLEKMHFSWEKPRKKRSQNAIEEKPIKYLRYYYSQHKTINDIAFEDVVEFEGEEIKIGAYIRNVCQDHLEYLNGNKKVSSPIYLMRYSFFDDMEFIWDTEKRNAIITLSNDIMIKYLRYHYSKHKTINNIGYDEVVTFEGQELKIGAYLTGARAKHREYLKNPTSGEGTSVLSQERYRILESMNFEWVRQPKTAAVLATSSIDPYIEYLKEHYAIHRTINNLSEKTVVEFNGKKLQIGAFVQRIRARHRDDVKNNFENIPELRRERYQLLADMGFNFVIPETITLAQIARDNNIDELAFTRLVKKLDGDSEKALKIIASLKRLKDRREKHTCKDLIVSEFIRKYNLDLKTFYTSINNKPAIVNDKKETIHYDDTMTLEEFCTRNNFNFELISKAIRLKENYLPEEDFASLINRVIIDSKIPTKRFTPSWVHSKYANVGILKSFLSSNEFSWESIFRNIRANIVTLDEAIEDEAFRKNKPNGQGYLEEIYHEYVSFYKKAQATQEYDSNTITPILDSFKTDLIKEYNLTEEEIMTITKAFDDYRNVSRQYKLLDVGFEKDDAKREEKIISYNLTPEEVEDAFFYPLNFNETELLGRNSELYQRRSIIKNITLSWNSLSSEEKSKAIADHNLSMTEVTYIIGTRRTIDNIKDKIYKK